MNVIVVGCGRVGAELATSVTACGHSVTVVDKVRRAFRRLPGDWDGATVQGLGFDRETLIRAGVEHADALAAVTSGDNSNILSARIASETFEVPRVVARIYDPRRAVIYERLGIATVATVTWTTDQITRRLIPDRTAVEWADPTGDLLIVERLLTEPWAGRRLSDLGGDRLRVEVVVRAGAPVLVGPDTIGHDGDMVYVLAHRDALDELDAKLHVEEPVR
jgi:trk system potassium uptake protein TrkA